MRNLFLLFALKFIAVLLLQVLLFNNIDFLGYISPYIYLIFFFDLPLNFKTSHLMWLGAAMGLVIDIFSNTIGVHFFASVLLCFVRNAWIGLTFPALNAAQNELTLGRVGVLAYLKYIVGLVLLHHTALFLLESFSLMAFGYTFIRILLNTVATVLLVLCYEYFRGK